MNNRGITLLEAIIAMLIMCMVMQAFASMITYQTRVASKITNQLNTATTNANNALAQGNHRNFSVVYFPPGQCKAIDNYWGKQVDSLTVMIYTNSTCITQLGTLNQSNNSTYFNDITSTLWVISSSVSGLRAVVINL